MRNKRKPYLTPLLHVVALSQIKPLATSGFNLGEAPDASKEPGGPPELDTQQKYWDSDRPDDYWPGF